MVKRAQAKTCFVLLFYGKEDIVPAFSDTLFSPRVPPPQLFFLQGELALTIMGIDGEITPQVMAKLSALSVRMSLLVFMYTLCHPPLLLESHP